MVFGVREKKTLIAKNTFFEFWETDTLEKIEIPRTKTQKSVDPHQFRNPSGSGIAVFALLKS